MKAISLHQPWANLIAEGKKIIETRFWETKHRGDLVICSTKNPRTGPGPFGVALCVVKVETCIPMEPSHAEDACIEYLPERWAWILNDIRVFPNPLPAKGRQGFFNLEINRDVVGHTWWTKYLKLKNPHNPNEKPWRNK